MLIGIDGNEANVEKKVGISEYAFELLKQFFNLQFPTRSKLGEKMLSNFQFSIYLKNKPRLELPKEREDWQYRLVKPRMLWTQIALPLDLYFRKPKPDVFFSPTHYGPRLSPVPTVISIMDLSYIYYPEMFKVFDLYQLKNWTKYSAVKAQKVLTISQTSKDDIIKTYRIPEKKVVVTYPGIKFRIQNTKCRNIMQNSKTIKDKYSVGKDYILFVGTLQPRKNITRLIEAFSKIKQADINLLIVGKKGWLYEEILEAPQKYGVEARVKFLGFVKDKELNDLYQNALCFVLPSLYEGFGLPVLEAMKNGCPVITSNVSSLPEAGGEAALYVDPTDTEDIRLKIEKVINNKELRDEMIQRGYEQIKKFSWEKTAKETLKVLEEVGGK